MTYTLNELACRNLSVSVQKEWLLTNGLGGYSMGTPSGINTRRYHGLLVAATDPPATRMVLLAAIDAFIQGMGSPIGISSNQYPGAIYPEGYLNLSEFSVGNEVRWVHTVGEDKVVQTLKIHSGHNAVTIRYKNEGKNAFRLTLRPLVCHKFYHSNFHEDPGYPENLSFPKNSTVIGHQGVTLCLDHRGAQRLPVQGWYYRFEYQREIDRGLDPRDDLFCPCELHYELLPGEEAVITAAVGSVSKPETVSDLGKPGSPDLEKYLSDAASKFLVKTSSRTSLIAGYPWFTDWGRDTMISLPGALIHTGRLAEARKILDDYSSQMFQGLIPNRFVEKGEKPDYNTVDATLWYANSIYHTLQAEWDGQFAKRMLKSLQEVFELHTKGTLYGIKVDQSDGLLSQGEGDVQLTWMDAKIGDWVVTPRHGKPVEINGLWINALRILEWLSDKLQVSSERYKQAADFAESNFEKKFWRENLGFYLDTCDPDDGSLRPNQVIAMSLVFSPAKGERAKKALSVVSKQLLTPVGLRTLGPNEPGYKGQYRGPLPEMDAAYHQGTVWPWLLGPYVSAYVKLNRSPLNDENDKKVIREAKRIVREAKEMLQQCGLGGISEVYDGDPPHLPNGCPYQAWSSSELLRVWKEYCE